MNLKPRFLLLTALLMLLSGAGIWFLSQQIALGVLQSWALRAFETQVRLEKERSLQPVIREVALARQFSDSQVLRAWAEDEQNPQKKQLALAEMEASRSNFSDHSYFVALLQSGDYYHNNASNEFAGNEYRYTLRADNPNDRWFYSIIEQDRDIHLNVNPDIPLKVTKLWIDVLLRSGERTLGVVGTGLDLTQFIKQVTTAPEPGINNLFVDHEGAIQISQDISQIDFASITKAASEQKTIWQQLSSPAENKALKQAMHKAATEPGSVASLHLQMKGSDRLAGVVYLPEVDWYVITLVDLNALLPLSTFNHIFLLAGCSIFIALLLFNLALNRYVLSPLRQVEGAIEQLREGNSVEGAFPDQTHGEIGRIMGHFKRMAADVLRSRDRLEARVRQRTEELEQQTFTDPVTGLLNRRGMMKQLEQETERLEREDAQFGILWLDLDLFKTINDRFGHAAGDRALIATAQVIRSHIRPYDCASRWGGDEFLILVKTDQQTLLDQLGHRLCDAVQDLELFSDDNERLPLTLSAGSCLAIEGESLNEFLACADRALYQAKESGRNQYRPGFK